MSREEGWHGQRDVPLERRQDRPDAQLAHACGDVLVQLKLLEHKVQRERSAVAKGGLALQSANAAVSRR